MDQILLQGIEFRGHHGVSPEEQAIGGWYSVDLEVDADTRRAGQTDRVEDTVDYGEIHRIVIETGEGQRYHLLEALAERLAERILEVPGVARVRLAVRKHHPPLPGTVRCAAVRIERGN